MNSKINIILVFCVAFMPYFLQCNDDEATSSTSLKPTFLTPADLETKINNLWNDISKGYEYVNFRSFYDYYKGANQNEFKTLLKNEGLEEEIFGDYSSDNPLRDDPDNDLEDIMYEEEFKAAAGKGLLPLWQINLMDDIFLSINPKGENNKYIVLDDMEKKYPEIEKTVLKDIMETYGKLEDSERRLYFHEFMILMNLGYIPGPDANE